MFLVHYQHFNHQIIPINNNFKYTLIDEPDNAISLLNKSCLLFYAFSAVSVG